MVNISLGHLQDFFIFVILAFIIFHDYTFEEMVLDNPVVMIIGGGSLIGALWEHLRYRKEDKDYEENKRKEEINELKHEINQLKKKKTSKRK